MISYPKPLAGQNAGPVPAIERLVAVDTLPGGVVYVSVQSTKWPYMVARHPMFLNSSKVVIDTTALYPPIVCASASRNDTHYTLSLYC